MFDKNFEFKEEAGDLVFGLVAPVGIDLDIVISKMTTYLTQYQFDVHVVHLSTIANTFFNNKLDNNSQHLRISIGMERCSKLRQEYERNDFFALSAISEISKNRKGKSKNKIAYIVRSIKHPDEIITLKKVYGQSFYLTGITASKETRRKHLQSGLGIDNLSIVDELIEKDHAEENKYGQNTRDVFQNADVFIDLDNQSWDDSIGRFTDLVFGNPLITPTPFEHSMFLAYMASVRSGDLSRQVGAVITSKEFDILSLGANDVPKYGGGQYWPKSDDWDDDRDIVRKIDPNEERRNEIVLNVMAALESEALDESKEDKLERGKRLLKDTGLLDLTEYGRVVHAEMEALLCAARNGVGISKSLLFTTTFPCHNCAKHIVAAGVDTVKFIEPYPKSYATKLHSDSISVESKDNGLKKVKFEPFVGVGPRRYLDLFSMSLGSGEKSKRKLKGCTIQWSRSGKSPRTYKSQVAIELAESKYAEYYRTYIVSKKKDHSKDPLCEKCGSIMVKRVASRGKQRGRQFWGCSTYPKCNSTVSIN